MGKRHNIARMKTNTIGNGVVTLTTAADGAITFAQAGVTDGETVSYGIREGNNAEVGRGTYTAAGTTLSRDTVLKSTNGGLPIVLAGAAEVYVTVLAEDFDHTELTNIGTNTHAQIDSHIGNTSNPHSVTLAQVGGTTDHTALSNIGTNTHAQVDSHIGNTSNPHAVTLAQVGGTTDHTALSNIGTNTHGQIDSHIGNTSNPHSVTLAQVGGTTDHTALSNIGTNTHPQIDTYIAQALEKRYAFMLMR